MEHFSGLVLTVHSHPSPNFGYPRGARGRQGYLRPLAIVRHITAGSFAATDSWFRNPESGASSHFVIDRDGTIHQYVRTSDAAYTCGYEYWRGEAYYNPDRSIPWINEVWRSQISPNLVTVNIEYVCDVGEQITTRQEAAGVCLEVWLLRHVVDDSVPFEWRIVGHSNLTRRQRPYDPGNSIPVGRMNAEIERRLAPMLTEAEKETLVNALNVFWTAANDAERVNETLGGVGLRIAKLDDVAGAIKHGVGVVKVQFGLG